MKKPERFPANDPREWMNRARSNLAMAKNRVPQAYLEDLCFEAQQAAEKAVKALMIKHGIDFPYVHDLALLLSLLREAGEVIPDVVGQARRLTRFATVTRYPMNDQAVTERQYVEAVAIAEAVIRWSEERLEEKAGLGPENVE